MRIQVLGPVQVSDRGRPVDVGPPGPRGVLGLLALAAGRPLSPDDLVDALWPDGPPASAANVVQTHIKRLRRALEPSRLAYRPSTLLPMVGGGYALRVPLESIDLQRFRRLVSGASGPDAGLTLGKALRLWHGRPLADIPYLTAHPKVVALVAERHAALLGYGRLLIESGDCAAALAVLEEATAEQPLDEVAHGYLIRAYHGAGQRSRAFAAYDAVRRRLADELGVDPGTELASAYLELLRATESVVVTSAYPMPAQLPADLAAFTGRAAHLRRLDALLAGSAPAVISGTAGVGKTALAVHWAHRVAHRFPDGQLHVNLRGFDPDGPAMDPAQAIRGFLDALQVPPPLPAEPAAQAALYRSALAGRRMLILLDNARDSAQVRPLLPGAPGCLVVVTSRNRLTSLVVAIGAHPLPLDLLTPDEARALLTRRLGPRGVAAEPDAVDEIIASCAGLPLALALVAARAALHMPLSLASLAAEVRDCGTRLDVLADDDPATDLRAVFSWSYRALTLAAARLFRLLGLHAGPDISAAAAASLAALPLSEVRPLLAELAAANLIAEHRPGRYSLHDLLRFYAADLAQHTDPADQRHATTVRMLDHYLHTAYAADRLLLPSRNRITIDAAQTGTTPEQPATYQDAVDWFTAEYPVLRTAVQQATVAGLDLHTWQLAWSLASFLHLRGLWHDWVDIGRAAMAAAQRLAVPTIQAQAHGALAMVYLILDRHAEARSHLEQALGHAYRIDDPAGQGHYHYSLNMLEERLGRHAEALHHAEQALDRFTRAGWRPGMLRALNGIGWLHSLLGDHQHALSYCERALAMAEEMGDEEGQANTWDSLGYIHHHLGNHARAITCYQRAIDLRRDRGDRYELTKPLTNLGDTHHATGDHEAARAAWQQALSILEDLQHADADEVRARIHQLTPVAT